GRRHTRFSRDWRSDVCSSDLRRARGDAGRERCRNQERLSQNDQGKPPRSVGCQGGASRFAGACRGASPRDQRGLRPNQEGAARSELSRLRLGGANRASWGKGAPRSAAGRTSRWEGRLAAILHASPQENRTMAYVMLVAAVMTTALVTGVCFLLKWRRVYVVAPLQFVAALFVTYFVGPRVAREAYEGESLLTA